jgi:hypothetical protein
MPTCIIEYYGYIYIIMKIHIHEWARAKRANITYGTFPLDFA